MGSGTMTNLLRAILERPHDDGLRLIYADALEERGGTARAEFCRVQCELARPLPQTGPQEAQKASNTLERYRKGAPVPLKADTPAMRLVRDTLRLESLRRREKELLEKHGSQWQDEVATAIGLDGLAWHLRFAPQWKRGFVASVSCRLEDWIGLECERCQSKAHPVRGCSKCDGTGRIGAHGQAIVAAQPIDEVRLTDVTEFFAVPEFLRAALLTLPIGIDRVSTALVAWARDKAGLPELEVTKLGRGFSFGRCLGWISGP
jgi:uncharacterized protein (TIGR02996 family)